jgi:hypothetical protein
MARVSMIGISSGRTIEVKKRNSLAHRFARPRSVYPGSTTRTGRLRNMKKRYMVRRNCRMPLLEHPLRGGVHHHVAKRGSAACGFQRYKAIGKAKVRPPQCSSHRPQWSWDDSGQTSANIVMAHGSPNSERGPRSGTGVPCIAIHVPCLS